MSVNRQVPHVFVIPEDDANGQLANGFQRDHSLETRRMQILEEAGGWQDVLNCFNSEHVHEMERNSDRFIVLLIDFDGREDRLDAIKAQIPSRLKERVFVLGAWNEPEDLRRECRLSYEEIGERMARDCRNNTEEMWGHRLLRHNAGELERLRKHVRPILFPDI